MNLKEAVEALYDGKRIRRKCWPKRCFAEIDHEYGLVSIKRSPNYIGFIEGDDPTEDDYVLYDEPILNDKEHEWLTNVTKSFMNDIVTVTKRPDGEDKEYISILTAVNKGGNKKPDLVYRETNFPSFKKDSMYEGMEIGRPYTREELGLI